jgi:hypothetical protein
MYSQIEVDSDKTVYDINGEKIGTIKVNEFGGEYLEVVSPKDMYPSELLALVKYFVQEYWTNPDWKVFRDEVQDELFMVLQEEG